MSTGWEPSSFYNKKQTQNEEPLLDGDVGSRFKKVKWGCLVVKKCTQVDESKDSQVVRTELLSTKNVSGLNIVISIFLLCIICGMFVFYQESLLAFSLSKMGIRAVQAATGPWQMWFWRGTSSLGGGAELVVAWLAVYLAGSRKRSVYYLALLTLDKAVVGYFKLFLAAARPYMLESKIVPDTCSTTFGAPSGHSSAAVAFAITVFLDVFHGHTQKNGKRRFFGWGLYIVAMVFCLFWAAGVPYSRYLLGAHSLDQVLFGVSLGFWEGVTMHFLVRDNLQNHFVDLLRAQNLILTTSGEQYWPASAVKRIEDQKDLLITKYRACAGAAALVAVCYTGLVIGTFEYVNRYTMNTDSEYFKKISKGYLKNQKCTESIDQATTMTLQNFQLVACAFPVVLCSVYVFQLLKLTRGHDQHIKIQDSNRAPKHAGARGKVLVFKIVAVAALIGLANLPLVFLTMSTLASPVALMFTNVLLPGMAAAYVLAGGPLDAAVQWFQDTQLQIKPEERHRGHSYKQHTSLDLSEQEEENENAIN